VANPLTGAAASAGVPYAASVSANAVQPAGDGLTFAKVTGPAWLNVAPDGSLSGTPTLADLGTNFFTVTLSDTNGWSSSASLQIVVIPAPLIASLGLQGTNLVLSWTGGQPPYQVQMAADIENPLWHSIAGPLTNSSLALQPTNAAAFYRIQCLQP
jgi:Putative Ig domain